MKRALLVGIDRYDSFNDLRGCVNDVNALTPLLARHHDAALNFDCHAYTSDAGRVTRPILIEALDALLRPGADVALLYFAGHGAAATNDVTLVSQDGTPTEAGIPLSAVLGRVQNSPVREVIIILDCCFSGAAGGVPQLGGDIAALRAGVAVLAASRGDQTAAETARGRGLFSMFLCGALDGGAADVLGRVTLAGIYSYLSESFGPWDQRPTFKANLDRLHKLRTCAPAVPLPDLRRLPEIFGDGDQELLLDPSYEPDAEPQHEAHEEIFGILQRCRAAKLVEPVGADHMYFAAMESKGCRLTPLGKHYWRLAQQGRL
jgi:hypothetical protein